MSKSDKELGNKVRKHLINKEVETPMISNAPATEAHQRQIIAQHFTSIMQALNLNLNDDSLSGTPDRVAKMFVSEIFYGLNYDKFPKCTAIENKMQYDEMITINDIDVSSTCEHHFVVIDGFAKVAYIPKNKVIGLSKINRIVEFFSKRPQVQERLTEQIYHALCLILETEDIAVMINAVHHCVKSRGVRDTNSSTRTTKLGGVFRDNDSARMEFLSYIK